MRNRSPANRSPAQNGRPPMPKYGYSMFSFSIHKHGETKTPMRLGDLHGDGITDGLPIVGAILNGMGAQRWSEKEKHIRVLSTFPRGRTVRFTMEIGNSGQQSRFHDPDSDDDTVPVFERSGRHIEVDDPRRGLLLMTAGSTTGLLILEAKGKATGKDQLAAVVKRTLKAHSETSGLIMDFNPLVDADALEKYLAEAAVNAITLRRSGISRDIAEAVYETPPKDEYIGRMELKIDPGGLAPVRQALAKTLRRDDGRRRKLLQVHGMEFEELSVGMDVGDRQIHLSVTGDRVPSFVYHIANYRPDDQQFYREVAAMVPDAAKAVGITVGPDWQTDTWSEEAATREIPTVAKEGHREPPEQAE